MSNNKDDKIKPFRLRKYIVLITIVSLILCVVVPGLIYWYCCMIGQSTMASDILQYIGAVLSYLGTVILGCLALYQTEIIQRKSEENEKLLVKMEKERRQPQFSIQLENCKKRYEDLTCSLSNYSSNIAKNVSISIKSGANTCEIGHWEYINANSKQEFRIDRLDSAELGSIHGMMSYVDCDRDYHEIEVALEEDEQGKLNFVILN